MYKLVLLVLFLLVAAPVWSQVAPVPIQGAGVLEGSHVFTGLTFSGLIASWPTASTARWLMVFDATVLPVNGATNSCTATVASCLAYCFYLPESTTAPNRFTLDWTMHPVQMRNGVVVALSTNAAGCTTLTVDGANNFFYAQVH